MHSTVRSSSFVSNGLRKSNSFHTIKGVDSDEESDSSENVKCLEEDERIGDFRKFEFTKHRKPLGMCLARNKILLETKTQDLAISSDKHQKASINIFFKQKASINEYLESKVQKDQEFRGTFDFSNVKKNQQREEFKKTNLWNITKMENMQKNVKFSTVN